MNDLLWQCDALLPGNTHVNEESHVKKSTVSVIALKIKGERLRSLITAENRCLQVAEVVLLNAKEQDKDGVLEDLGGCGQ